MSKMSASANNVMSDTRFKIQKRELKINNFTKNVGCKWIYGNKNSQEKLVNLEYNNAMQLLIIYWPDVQQSQVIQLCNIMQHHLIPPDRVVLHCNSPVFNIQRSIVELRFPTEGSHKAFMDYITPQSSDSGNSTDSNSLEEED